jgi:hypothetical protein
MAYLRGNRTCSREQFLMNHSRCCCCGCCYFALKWLKPGHQSNASEELLWRQLRRAPLLPAAMNACACNNTWPCVCLSCCCNDCCLYDHPLFALQALMRLSTAAGATVLASGSKIVVTALSSWPKLPHASLPAAAAAAAGDSPATAACTCRYFSMMATAPGASCSAMRFLARSSRNEPPSCVMSLMRKGAGCVSSMISRTRSPWVKKAAAAAAGEVAAAAAAGQMPPVESLENPKGAALGTGGSQLPTQAPRL